MFVFLLKSGGRMVEKMIAVIVCANRWQELSVSIVSIFKTLN